MLRELIGLLIFVTSDCPISNGYAPEIRRICDAYAARGVSCTLVYEDMAIDEAAVRAHQREYGYRNLEAVIDRDRSIAGRVKATVTPQAVVVSKTGAVEVVKYRGRIDNEYVSLGRRRRVVTEHDVKAALDALLAGRRVARRETDAFGCFIVPARSQDHP